MRTRSKGSLYDCDIDAVEAEKPVHENLPDVLRTPQRLETLRLELRQFHDSDWQPLCDLFRNKECVKYTFRETLEDWQTWRILACYIGHWTMRGYGPYAVVERQSREFVGAVGLWFPADWPEPELKWALRRGFWGKGYATEAAAAVQTMVQRSLQWQRLISLIFAGNERSIAVAERLGAKFEKDIPFRGALAHIFSYELKYSPKTDGAKVQPTVS